MAYPPYTLSELGNAPLFPISVFAREIVVVDLFDAGVLDMGRDLCGGNAGMAQHHCGQIV